MYSCSKLVVYKNNLLSQAGNSERGVRRGDGLSRLLFTPDRKVRGI